jgi:hypothetical protein
LVRRTQCRYKRAEWPGNGRTAPCETCSRSLDPKNLGQGRYHLGDGAGIGVVSDTVGNLLIVVNSQPLQRFRRASGIRGESERDAGTLVLSEHEGDILGQVGALGDLLANVPTPISC